MITRLPRPVHPRYAELVEDLQEYLATEGRSARWLGITVANDARLMPNLKRGQQYPTRIMLALYKRLVAFYEADLAKLETEVAELEAELAPMQRLAA